MNYYTSPPEYVTHERHLKFAHYLQKAGYKVMIFSTGYLERQNISLIGNGKKYQMVDYGEYHFCHVKSGRYKGNGIKRGLSIFQFALRLFLLRNNFEKPDYILHNIHEPFDYPIVWCAKLRKAKYIVDDWDLWAISFANHGLIKKDGIIDKLIRQIEYSLFKKADAIIISMEGGKDYINDRGFSIEHGGKVNLDKVHYINNGVDLAQFEQNYLSCNLEDSDLTDKNHFKAVYVGSISKANEVEMLVEAARYLKDEKRLRILIYGDGSDRERLEEKAREYKIDNLFFKEKRIPLSNVPYVLRNSNLSLLNHNRRAGKYGISFGKFFQYLAAGKPICGNIDPSYNYVTKYNLGISKIYASPEEYADAIRSFIDMPEDKYLEMSRRVETLAKEFDYPQLSQKLIKIINSL